MKQVESLRPLIIILLLPVLVHGQQVGIGVKAGLSIPELKGGNNEVSKGYTSRLAPIAGVQLEWAVKKTFAVQAELNYAGQGGKREGMQPITDPPPGLPALPAGSYYYARFNNEAKLNYLELPVLLKWSSSNMYFLAGPYLGYLVSAHTETSGSSNIYMDKGGTQQITPQAVDFGATTNIKDDIHRLNLGLSAGIGLVRKAGPGSVVIDGRINYGLRNIQKDTEKNGKSHTGGVFITAGYMFSLQ